MLIFVMTVKKSLNMDKHTKKHTVISIGSSHIKPSKLFCYQILWLYEDIHKFYIEMGHQ